LTGGSIAAFDFERHFIFCRNSQLSEFEPAVKLVLMHEGGFASNPNDNDGGCTNFGITLKFYRKSINPDATVDDIRNLTREMAVSIYDKHFWNRQTYSDILDQDIANRVFDLAVNIGPAHATACLQRAVNSCIGAHLIIDGTLGKKTLDATNSIAKENLYSALLDQAQHYYEHIVEHHPQDKIFLKGWLNRLKT